MGYLTLAFLLPFELVRVMLRERGMSGVLGALLRGLHGGAYFSTQAADELGMWVLNAYLLRVLLHMSPFAWLLPPSICSALSSVKRCRALRRRGLLSG
jgi:hypothetical protein